MFRFAGLGCLCLGMVLCHSVALAEQTKVHVRVISKGAKFIGTSMGGVKITIKDALTGKLLAEGKTQGTTGDTKKIMKQEKTHHASVSTEDAAAFRTSFDLSEPRRIKVVAQGPLAQPQAMQTVSATQWVIPGKPITGGDAFCLEMPGFVVDVLDPPAHKKLTMREEPLELTANVTMMCGCPIEPDGLWDAKEFQIGARIKRDGELIAEAPLLYAGSTSQFSAKLEVNKPGVYEVTVFAFDPENGNTGIDKTTFLVQPRD